ncbi:hypothetical protein IFO69_07960 [Echinicola sp. CAU 1574]|uniref:Uncharacterized protein n=1 Tax=Echinicola arenosa TaxID=2774144 RepID=A0ABR9AM27_9BACT|nr:hypothetical protein [Echinicola arenosa]MBD8488674.1 hypothetical protein [Echinicola arenosa]
MTKYFTLSDQLIRYVYQEMSEAENIDFEQKLRENEALMQDYLDILGTVDKLNGVMLEPSDVVVKAIKRKAKSSGLEKV